MDIFLSSQAGGSIGSRRRPSSSATTPQQRIDEPSGDSFRDAADYRSHEILRRRLAQRVRQHGQLFLRFL